MKSFNGDKKFKLLIQKEIEWHAKQDKLAQGSYASDGKFCAIGCAIESTNKKLGTNYSHDNHQALENQFNIPRILWRLEDRIFEGLSKEDAMRWPLQFWISLPVGVDLSLVWYEFIVWLLGDKKDGVIQYAKIDNQKKVIQNVIDLYERKIKGEDITQEEWRIAHAAAYTAYATADAYTTYTAYATAAAADAAAHAASHAAAYTAYTTYTAYTAYAADAADAADAAAAYTAYTAYATYTADAAAHAAAEKHYKKMAKKLLKLLKEKK